MAMVATLLCPLGSSRHWFWGWHGTGCVRVVAPGIDRTAAGVVAYEYNISAPLKKL